MEEHRDIKKKPHNAIRKTEGKKEKKFSKIWAGYKKIILEKWVGNRKQQRRANISIKRIPKEDNQALE